MQNAFSFQAIGRVQSPFREKFGIPRQPGLVRVPARIHIQPEYAREEAFRGLDAFSHIWVSFVFHQTLRERWKPTVRPPRLGGNERVGVFASRSMFRPNPLGLSVVELVAVKQATEGMVLDIVGADMLDGTPVLDIKPYLPYVDALPDARAGYAPHPPGKLPVRFSSSAQRALQQREPDDPALQSIITEILQYDPRPAYRSGSSQDRTCSMRLYDFDVKWRVDEQGVWVIDLVED